jgi:hypothetical protein
MAETKAKFPSPEDSDAEDVVLALETANALWGRSDAKEAIRWLRRAAEAAEEAGDDVRALTLARTAADLTTQVEQEAPAPAAKTTKSSPAAAPRPAQAPAATRPAKPVASAPVAASSPAAASAPGKSSPTAQSAPAASAAKAPAEPSVSKSDAAASKKSQPPPPPPPPASSPVSTHAEPKLARRSEGSPSGLKAPATKGTGEKPKDALAHLAALASADASTGTPRVRRSLGPYQALRVAIEPSKDDRKLLLARVLNQSEEAPENTHEAMLVCTVANADMRSRRR